MKLPVAENETTSRPGKRGPWAPRGRAYVFLVATLAVFLLGFFLTYQPPHGYLAEATIVHLAPPNDEPATAGLPLGSQLTQISRQAATELTSDAALRRAALNTGLGEASDLPAAKIDHLRQLIRVSADPNPAREVVEITLQVTQDDPQLAVSLAGALAQHYVQTQAGGHDHNRLDRLCQDANLAVQQAKTGVAQASVEVERLLHEHMDALHELESLIASAGPPGDKPPAEPKPAAAQAPPAPAVPEMIPNPALAKMHDELRILTADRDRLLKTRTELHPEVRQVLGEIAELESIRAATPAEIPNPEYRKPPAPSATPDPLPSRDGEEQRRAQRIADQRAKVEQISAEYRQAQQTLDAARSREATALTAQKQAVRQQQAANRPLASVAAPARLVARLGERMSGFHLLLLAAAGVAAGVVMMRLSKLRVCQGVFLSTMELQQRLAVPVIGAIPTTDGPPLSGRLTTTGRIARVGITVCECVLVVAALLFALTIVADISSAGSALSDPLTSIAETARRLLGR